MQSQDVLYIVLAVTSIFIGVPLMLILWRVYFMMERVNKLIGYLDHLRQLAQDFEKIPMKFIENVMDTVIGNTPKKK